MDTERTTEVDNTMKTFATEKLDKPWEAMYRALLVALYKSIIQLKTNRRIAINLAGIVTAHVKNMAEYDGVPEEEWIDYRGWRND